MPRDPTALDHLREGFLLFDQLPARLIHASQVGRRLDHLSPGQQSRVDRGPQLLPHNNQQDDCGNCKHQGEQTRERQGQPGPDRHGYPAFRRYPAPRTVSSIRTRKGASIFWRR